MESAGSRPWALVTGASSGIGAAIARELAVRGHDLVISARRAERLGELAGELRGLGVRVEIIAADLAGEEGARGLAAEVERRGLAVSVLVNNAGFGDSAAFASADEHKVMDMVAVNVGAVTLLTRLVLPGMVARGRGRVLNVGSIAGFLPGPGMAVYYASKAYVESFSRALAHELRGTGVTVTLLAPGPVATEFSSVARPGREKRTRHTRSMDPARVARAAVEGMLRGRAVVVPGWSNAAAVLLARLAPRGLSARAAAWFNTTV